jgi:hypothetical protein
MSTQSTPPLEPGRSTGDEKAALGGSDIVLDDHFLGEGKDLLALQDVDPALNAKMHIVNNVSRYLLCASKYNQS